MHGDPEAEHADYERMGKVLFWCLMILAATWALSARVLRPVLNSWSPTCIRAEMGKFANGQGCLAAQIVAHFKTDVGQFYLYPSGTRDVGEEFTYIVTIKDGKPHLTIREGSVAAFGQPGSIKAVDMPCIWEGFAADFDATKAAEEAEHH